VEDQSTLFANLVMQQSNMAMMLLGQVAHPESGEVVKDLEAAKMFIDQLEMLETKTKGNLTKEESSLLKQMLMALRLAFVESVDSDQKGAKTPAAAGEVPSAAAPSEDEARKKFSKKY
jgi:hypothetical protein